MALMCFRKERGSRPRFYSIWLRLLALQCSGTLSRETTMLQQVSLTAQFWSHLVTSCSAWPSLNHSYCMFTAKLLAVSVTTGFLGDC